MPAPQFGGDPQVLVYILVGIVALAVAAPLTIFLIRVLNQTWLDSAWRKNEELHRGGVAPTGRGPSQGKKGPMSPGSSQEIMPQEARWGITSRERNPGG
jgi:hypothetical protein